MTESYRSDCEALIRAHRPTLYRVAIALGCDRDEAEDLAQEVSVAAWRTMQRGTAVADWRRWLLTVLRHRFTDRLRSRYRRKDVPLPEQPTAAGTPGPAEQAESSEEQQRLHVELIRPEHRCLRLQLAGLSYLEIAALVKRTVVYVRHDLAKSRSAIRRRLAQPAERT